VARAGDHCVRERFMGVVIGVGAAVLDHGDPGALASGFSHGRTDDARRVIPRECSVLLDGSGIASTAVLRPKSHMASVSGFLFRHPGMS